MLLSILGIEQQVIEQPFHLMIGPQKILAPYLTPFINIAASSAKSSIENGSLVKPDFP